MKAVKLDQKIGKEFSSVTIVTNVNVFLYSTCRFMVAGALPVRFMLFDQKCKNHTIGLRERIMNAMKYHYIFS